jgi:hypothetical protein
MGRSASGKAVQVTDAGMVTAELGAIGQADGIALVQRRSGEVIADA